MLRVRLSVQTIVGAVLAGLALAVAAQTAPIKPGLWESSMRIQSNDMPPVDPLGGIAAELDKMPFEQRKKTEQMLLQQGIAVGPDGARSRMCMSADMIARMTQPSREGSCQTTPAPMKGNTIPFDHRCTQPATQGQGVITFDGPEAYSMQLQTQTQIAVPASGTQPAQTVSVRTRIQSSSQWMGADCQGMAPPPAPK